MNPLLDDAARRAQAYLDGLDGRPVAPADEAIAALARFDEPLADAGHDAAATLALLDEVGSPATMAMAGRRFFGFVIGGSLPVSLAANWLAGAWDQNAAMYRPTPSAAHLEQVALRWAVELLGLPAGSGAAFVSGATVANFSALAAGRHAVLAKAGWNVEADGLFGAPPITVIVGEEAHPSLIKALGMLGLGRNRVVRVPGDAQGRMRADAIPSIQGPALLCAQVGNVNSGACDPLDAIADRVDGRAFLHVDGAFGLWAAAAPSRRPLVAGLARCDSWATDAHKWLNVPYDCGIAFVRDPEALRAAMAITADYLPTLTDQRNPCDYAPELSRRARGVEVWAALRTLGRNGVAELVERNCRQARRFADGLAAAGFEVLNEIALNQVVVAFGDAATTAAVIAAVQRDGTCWCGPTVWSGRAAMRISVSSWATTDADVEASLAAIIDCAATVGGR